MTSRHEAERYKRQIRVHNIGQTRMSTIENSFVDAGYRVPTISIHRDPITEERYALVTIIGVVHKG